MNATIPLSRHLCWGLALSLFDTPLKDRILPASFVQCPICQAKKLSVFPEPFLGEWFSCDACHFQGDSIEMAALAWGLSISTTVKKLAYIGVPQLEATADWQIDDYIRNHVERRKRLLTFWQNCRKRLAHYSTPEMRELARSLTTFWDFGCPDSQDRGVIGGCVRLDAEQCLFPGSTAYRKWMHHRGHGAGGRGIFRGGGWRDMLVVPFWSLPGLLSGLLFFGRQGDPAQGDFVFKSLQPPYRGSREAGLQNLDALYSGLHQQLGYTVFVIPDVLTAVAAQIAWQKASLTTPPIIGTFENDAVTTKSVWMWQPRPELVFLTSEFSLPLLLQAKNAGGHIAINYLPKDEFRHALAHGDILAWLAAAKRYARPWQTVLQDRLAKLPQNKAEALLLQIGFDWPQLRDFIQSCPLGLKERLERLLDGPRRTSIFGHKVTERDDAWYFEPSQEFLANGVVRIEKILLTAKHKRIFYRGHISFQGEQIPFTESHGVIERGGLAWVSKHLRKAGKGPLIYRQSWSHYVLSVAATFQKPEFFHQADTVGFRPGSLRFCFPKFTMTLNGEVSDPLPLIASGDVPAAHLERPQPLTGEEIAALSVVSADTTMLWAMVATLMDRLVIGTSSRSPSGIALVGAGAEVMGREAAKLLGCIECRIPPSQKTQKVVEQLQSAFGQHCWPPVVTGRVTPGLKKWLLESDPKNCIVPLDWHTACTAAIGGWHIIRHEGTPQSLEALSAAAAKLIPAYFQDLAQRRFIYPITQRCWIKGLLKDMAEWFERCGGDGRAVRAATRVLTGDRRYAPWRYFLDMVARLISDGELVIIDQGDSPDEAEQTAIVYCKASGPLPASVRLPKFAVNNLLSRNIPLPSVYLVERSFQDAGMLLGHTSDTNETRNPTWIFPRDVWDEQMRMRPEWRRLRPNQALQNRFALCSP
ncbi:MAG: hypothetical protein WCJ35_13545 [Planctomycetota bacterium]